MVDIFANLTDYMGNSMSLSFIAYIQLLYIPRSIVTGIPIAMVFATSYTMGTLQIRNELLAFYATGFSLRQIATSLVFFSLMLGVAMFFIQEYAAVPLQQERQAIIDTALNKPPPLSNSNVQIYDKNRGIVYYAQYYNNDTEEIQNLVLVRRSPEGKLTEILKAERALWKKSFWELSNIGRVVLKRDKNLDFEFLPLLADPVLDISPHSFMGTNMDFDSMVLEQAIAYVELRRSTGLTYRKEETKLLSRISFTFTPLVVMLLAISAGRRFRKHVILLSLLVSLGLAVLFYVIQLVAGLLADLNILPTFLGAWMSILILSALGLVSAFKSQH